MKKFILFSLVCLGFIGSSNAQILKKIKDKVNRKVDEKIDRAIDKTVDDAADGKKPADKKAGNDPATTDAGTTTSTGVTSTQSFANYAKFDFIPGDTVIFEDNIQDEETDEIPSKWIVEGGQAEVRMVNEEKVIQGLDGAVKLKPRIKNPSKMLGKRWTLEFDMMISPKISEYTGGNNYMNNIGFTNGAGDFKKPIDIRSWWKTHQSLKFKNAEGEYSGDAPAVGKFMHVSISANETSVKGYINSQRVMNVQLEEGSEANQEFFIQTAFNTSKELKFNYFKNFRLAKGGKDPYKQVTTDSKFIARGITFEYQSANIKPTSMGELNRIVTMLKDHTELKFEIGGHTSKIGDGSAAANLSLSEERAKNVRKKLAELGVDESRLTAKGYGEAKPIADNATADGRANNQRVEFIKK